ncbi:tRNA (adenine(22)-N(1))-methyltransferase TrmK [Lentibacillus halophilus]|uniref:tRNA (Adenine(22)-N(1))-methyltransferase TrmK n=1 Tax=Lentibacillus halophilus TaxID=295065 RepID=A0ABN0ZCP9_9BACI
MEPSTKLSKRLKKVASFVLPGSRFADIGSDHAYLPCYVCLRDPSAYAIVGELNKGPLQRARQTVSWNGLTDRIDVRSGDGLAVFHRGEVNTVVIAGMGGSLIHTILSDGEAHLMGLERIIVQPNTDERNVRQWFSTHGYSIIGESMVEDNGRIYEIIVADKMAGSQQLTGKQLLFGPHLLKQKPDLFYRKWEKEHMKQRHIIDQMTYAKYPDNPKIAMIEKETKWIKEELGHDCP